MMAEPALRRVYVHGCRLLEDKIISKQIVTILIW